MTAFSVRSFISLPSIVFFISNGTIAHVPLTCILSPSGGEDTGEGLAGLGKGKLYAKDHVIVDLKPGFGTDGLAGIGPKPAVSQ